MLCCLFLSPLQGAGTSWGRSAVGELWRGWTVCKDAVGRWDLRGLNQRHCWCSEPDKWETAETAACLTVLKITDSCVTPESQAFDSWRTFHPASAAAGLPCVGFQGSSDAMKGTWICIHCHQRSRTGFTAWNKLSLPRGCTVKCSRLLVCQCGYAT